MRKIFLSRDGLRKYVHDNYPGSLYAYSRKLFFYVLEEVEVNE